MNRRGMTLLELMTTVAVVGVMASMSMVGFDRLMRQQRQVSGIRDVASLVLEARSEARARNQAVRIDVNVTTAGNVVQWGRLPCGDAWGRNCPSTACTSTTTCGGSCVCEQRSLPITIPSGVVVTGLAGLCFVGSTGAPRGASCQQSAAAVSTVRFDLPNQPDPYLLVIEPLSGSSRLVDCGRRPKESSCP
jgi:prepilin-type N-terminal cleavage/methylation domain-containing protein